MTQTRARGDMEPVVSLQGITRSFPLTPPVHALRGIDLDIGAGSSIAVVGPSGSGKSTLLNVLGCLDRPSTGTYLLNGIDTNTVGDSGLAALRSALIGFVFQSFHLLSYRSVVENVMLAELYRAVGVETRAGRAKGDRAGRRERAEDALRRVGLGHRSSFQPTRLSGGERQRVAIARAIVHRPSVLFADEPTGNLDSANTTAVLALFDELRSDGLTIVTITHDREVAQHFDRRVHMRDGELFDDDGARLGTTPTELLAEHGTFAAIA